MYCVKLAKFKEILRAGNALYPENSENCTTWTGNMHNRTTANIGSTR